MKAKKNKLDRFAEKIDRWFTSEKDGGDGLTLAAAVAELGKLGCPSSPSALSVWWERRQNERRQEIMLGRIASGAAACKQVEKQFGRDPAPGLETLIKLHRVMILNLATRPDCDPEMLEMINQSMKPVMEFAKLEEKQKDRGLDERRLAILEKKAAQLDQVKAVQAETLTPQEREAKMKAILGIA